MEATLTSLADDCVALNNKHYHSLLSPATQLKAFRSILLTNREIHQIVSQIRLGGVKSSIYFQTHQKEMIYNVIKYARATEDFPCPFLDYWDLEEVVGPQFWKNPLIYRNFELVNMALGAFNYRLTPRLLCNMEEFIEAHLEEISESHVFIKPLAKSLPLQSSSTQRQLIITTGNQQIEEDFNRKIFIISDIQISPPIGPNETGLWASEFPRMTQNLSAWLYVDFDENEEFPDQWYLVNYKEHIVYDDQRNGFEEGEEIQQSIEEYRIDNSNYRHRNTNLW
jgi:hypothetical protein